MRITHSKVSTIPNAPRSSLVRSSDWNADHVIEGAIETSTVLLESSDLLSLPFELVEAPGDNKILFPVSCFGNYTFSSIPYTLLSETLTINYQSDLENSLMFFNADFMTSRDSLVALAVPNFAGGFCLSSDAINQPLVLMGILNDGDGALSITTAYQMISL